MLFHHVRYGGGQVLAIVIIRYCRASVLFNQLFHPAVWLYTSWAESGYSTAMQAVVNNRHTKWHNEKYCVKETTL
jgi:hypothetical protein